MRLLINGVSVATGSAAGAPLSAPAVPFGVGSAYLSNGQTNYPAFPGYARQVRFWNVGRTAAQISAALGESLPTDRTGLVAAWPLDESSGASAHDISGNGRALVPPSGALATTRAAVLTAGPFFATTTTAVSSGSLDQLTDGTLIDFDSDGDLDVVLVRVAWPPTVPETRMRLRAFRNNGGTFVDATDAVLGNVTMTHPRHDFVGDLDGDGRADLLIVGHGTDTVPFPGEQTKLFLQSADGRLVDETATRLPMHSTFTHNVTVADIDGDGDLDIYMCNINGGDSGPRFYLNTGSAAFTEATDRIPADIANRTNYVTFPSSLLTDLDGDGFPDLVLGGDSGPINEVLINDRTGRFHRNSRYALPPKLLGPTAITVAIGTADFNGDGASDLILSTTGGTIVTTDGRTQTGYAVPGLQLLLNRGDGTFYDATSFAGFTWYSSERWVVWPRIVDLNGDGRPDIVAQVHTANGLSLRLFLNRGGARFVDATEAFPTGAIGTFVHAGDFDRDGQVDLITASWSGVTVARNLKPIDPALFAGNEGTAPVIATQPVSRIAAVDTGVIFSVVVADAGPLRYQWRRNGNLVVNDGRFSGANSAELTIASVALADAGTYAVVVGNIAGDTLSSAASLSVVDARATHVVGGPGYVVDGAVTIANTLTYAGAATRLDWQVLLPAGWSYAGGDGSDASASAKPAAGATNLLEWTWTNIPPSPVGFTYALGVPAGQSGSLTALAVVQLAGLPGPARFPVKPDPLSASQNSIHTADTNRDFRFSLFELTRVIELYNTRNGTMRTGAYKVQDGTEDGFGTDSSRASTPTSTLTRHHSADSNRDGMLGLIELTRLIQLYNYRSGTIRTGQYHTQVGTEDGHAPGP